MYSWFKSGVQCGKYLGVANWAQGGWEVSAQSGESGLKTRERELNIRGKGNLILEGK